MNISGKKVLSKRAKSIKRHIYTSKRLGVGSERYSSGIGFVIIPSDVDRNSYIKFAYQTSEIVVITPTGEVIKDALVPKHIIKDLIFPEEVDERGSMVSWNNVPTLNQVIISGVLSSPGESYLYREWEKVTSLESRSNDNAIVQSWDVKGAYARLETYFEDSTALSEESGLEFVARSPKTQSKLKLSCNGEANLYGDVALRLMSEELIVIEVGSQEDEISTLKMDLDGSFEYKDRYGNVINIDGVNGVMIIKPNKELIIDADSKIHIGESATEPAVLGDKLTDTLSKLIDAIKLITVPTSMGPSGTPINALSFTAIKNQLSGIKSQLIKLE